MVLDTISEKSHSILKQVLLPSYSFWLLSLRQQPLRYICSFWVNDSRKYAL